MEAASQEQLTGLTGWWLVDGRGWAAMVNDEPVFDSELAPDLGGPPCPN